MVILLIWLISAAICSAIASNKNRNAGGWFVLGLIFGPLAVLVAAAMSPDMRDPSRTPRAIRAGLQSGALRKCPFCDDATPARSHWCRSCGEALPPPKRRNFFGFEVDD